MRRNTATVAGMLGAAAMVLVGCSAPTGTGDSDTGDSSAPSTDLIRMSVSVDPGAINPVMNATGSGEEVALFGYDSLLSSPNGSPAVGQLAEEGWEQSTTHATFTLKEGVVCVDGSPLSVEDVKATFEYAKENGSPYTGVYFHPEVEIETDTETRQVTFTYPTPDSFLAQSVGSLPIVCASGLEDPAKLDAEQHGTGPYKLVDISPGQSYTFELREEYAWGPHGMTGADEGLPSTVEVLVVDSDATRANMLQSGELDFATIGGQERDRLNDEDFAQTIEIPMRPGLLFFNQSEERPGNDLAVRQAIAKALDRDEIGAVSSAGRGEPLKSLVSSFGAGCSAMDSSAAIPTYDPATAENMLDEAGWVVGSDGIREKDGKKLSLVLLYPVSESPAVTAGIELMQTRLLEIGIDGVPTPSPAYTDVIFSGGDWDTVWAPIYTNYPSNWRGILSGEFPPNGGNWTYNTNQEYFDLAGQASELPGEEGCSVWEEAQNALFSNVEVLPFYSSTETTYSGKAEFTLSRTSLVPVSLDIVK